LKQSGKKVALVEGRTLGSGTTGFSTCKLSAQQGPVYTSIKGKLGKEAAKSYYNMNTAGIKMVGDLVRDLELDCEYAAPRFHAMWTSKEDSTNTSAMRGRVGGARVETAPAGAAPLLPLR